MGTSGPSACCIARDGGQQRFSLEASAQTGQLCWRQRGVDLVTEALVRCDPFRRQMAALEQVVEPELVAVGGESRTNQVAGCQRLSSKALLTTLTELSAIAPPANTGSR